MPKTRKKKTKDAYRKEALARADNRPWFDRATDRDFFTPAPGSHTLILTGEPEERVNDYGNKVLDIPTNQGVLSTGSYSILRPLARAHKRSKGKGVTGTRLEFRMVGVKANRRFEDVRLFDGKEAIT